MSGCWSRKSENKEKPFKFAQLLEEYFVVGPLCSMLRQRIRKYYKGQRFKVTFFKISKNNNVHIENHIFQTMLKISFFWNFQI